MIDWPPRDLSWRLLAWPMVVLLGLSLVVVVLGGDGAVFLALNGAGEVLPAQFWALTTDLGDTLVAACLLTLLARRHPEVIWAILVAAAVATLYTRGLKPFLDIPRPPSVLAPGELTVVGPVLRSGAFPSGHSATIATVCGVLAIHSISTGYRACMALVALLVGLSRVMVGAHWPLDVTFGLMGGWLSACLGSYVYLRRPFWRGPIARRVQLLTLLVIAVAVTVQESDYAGTVWIPRALGTLAGLSAVLGLWETTRGQVERGEGRLRS